MKSKKILKLVPVIVVILVAVQKCGFAQWTSSGNILYTNSNVSVGTSTNAATLYVKKSAATSLGIKSGNSNATLFLDKSTILGNAELDFKQNGNNLWKLGLIGNNDFQISTLNSSVPNLLISQSGFVGIGTAIPLYKLDVSGNANISDTLYTSRLRANSSDGDQIITVSGNSSQRVGFRFIRPTSDHHDWEILNDNGKLRIRSSIDDFQTIEDEVMDISYSGDGAVGIGTNASSNAVYKLSVCGSVRCTEVVIESGWCDYVFDKNYNLKPLEEVADFISQNHHLPNVPSAAEVESKGLLLGDISRRLIEKVEELTLYVIDQNERIKALEAQNSALKIAMSASSK